MLPFKITDTEFDYFRQFIYSEVGVDLSGKKKDLVSNRLEKRLRHYSLTTFTDYIHLVTNGTQTNERQVVIDLLTTNETFFFREPKHFDFLSHHILSQWPLGQPIRVWSAAASTGEEAYSIAMLLDDKLGATRWEVVGTDVNSTVLAKAKIGCYPNHRIQGIPRYYLRKYCLKGIDEYQGMLLIDQKLRRNVHFSRLNLNTRLPVLNLFDVIFLRNVLIYFDFETKQTLIKQLVTKLQPKGYLIIGHAESLMGVDAGLTAIVPTVFQKN